MSKQKPGIPEGTRDFGPLQVARRQYIFDSLRKIFTTYGYQPIETPSMERLSTLTGKYGEEGDRLIFKVLNNGDYLKKANKDALKDMNSQALVSSISKRGLRYDLTVPFARFVVMSQHELNFPFKRYQIQPVWRADRPQKGRYREFYQCDVDVIGTDSLHYEAELIQIYDQAFYEWNLKVIIRVNNRKVLTGIAEACGISDHFEMMTIAIDKLDKIGRTGVQKELVDRGIQAETAWKVLDLLDSDLATITEALAASDVGMKGVRELETVFKLNSERVPHNEIKFDASLARGLGYYTGCIFEVALDNEAYPDYMIGSLGGGGRYDDLTGIFGLANMSGVGVSFGADRIYDVLEALDLFPKELGQHLNLFIVAFDDDGIRKGFDIVTTLRQHGIACDTYPTAVKMKKQMKYANQLGVQYVGILGADELEHQQITIKNMTTGEQISLPQGELADYIQRNSFN